MTLGLVGHGAEKFTPASAARAKAAMHRIIRETGATRIVSGHSPMGGVDLWAEDLARYLGLALVVHAPRRWTWDGPGGYKARNLAIAEDSDQVVCVVVKALPIHFTGMRFPACYHCKGRNPEHVKSGGCWTAWHARTRAWEIIE